MNNPPYNTPAPQSGSGKKTVLIVVAVVVALCCLCTAVAGGGGAAFFLWNKPKIEAPSLAPFPTEEAIQIEKSPLPVEDTPVVEDTPAPLDTPVAEDTPTVESAPTATAKPVSPDDFTGLGVSRQEMISFYSDGGAFKFGNVTTIQGLEMVQGTHIWLCIGSNCAAVSLGGPAGDLKVIAIAVPTIPDNTAQTATSIALLMTTAARFTDSEGAGTIPQQLLEEIIAAQNAGQDLEKSYENNGYKFTVSYNAQTHNAGLAVTRPK